MKIAIEDASRVSAVRYGTLQQEDANACMLRLILDKDIDLKPGMVIRIEEDDER